MRRSLFVLCLCILFVTACGDDDPQGPPPANGQNFTDPVWSYDHSEGNSVTGGYVYRGPQLTDLTGDYVYGDFGSGRIWALSQNGSTVSNELLFDSNILISTFGLAPDGELLVMPYGNNRRIQRLRGANNAGTWTYDLVDATAHTFTDAVDLRSTDDGRIFVVEQAGRIQVFDPSSSAAPTTFLDLRSRVTASGELGLLGLAFPPDYTTRGQFFVYYTVGSDPWNVLLCRFDRSGDPNVADPATETLLLSIPQAYANHNGGALAFDNDGHLLVGVGDEGLGGDPLDHGQDPSDLHGTVLRIDVSSTTTPVYTIPTDNPSALGQSEFAPEVFAYGLRNPWRISVDPLTGDIWCADVGQNRFEEIDLIEGGANYGWDCREGVQAYTGPPGGPSSACN